ncbi:MAG: hypothetical protein JXP34_05155 [Planctomycetes bacterium]|nr:hypothetical protein [Planctomycetota bacterium]
MAERTDLLSSLTQALAEGFERIRADSLRVARLGRLNLDLLAARGRLRRAWNELGALAARRWLDDEAIVIDRKDPAIESLLERIREARGEVRRIEDACRTEREGGRGAGPGSAETGSSPAPGSAPDAGGGGGP